MRISHFVKKCKITGSISMLMAIIIFSLSYGANSVVDDCEDANSENLFESSWYVADDSKGGIDKEGKFENGIFLDTLPGGNSYIDNIPRKEKWDPDDSGSFNVYEEFTMTEKGNDDSKYSAYIKFQMGDIQPHYGAGVSEVYDNWVSLATELISTGEKLNCTGAKKISFYAKAKPAIKVWLVFTTDQGTFLIFATPYQHLCEITEKWKKFEITLDMDPSTGLAQPGWAITELNEGKLKIPGEDTSYAIMDLDIGKTVSLEWIVSVEDNKSLDKKSGELWIDDITIHNFKWHPEEYFPWSIVDANTGDKLDGDPKLLCDGGWTNMLDDGAWYAFNDAEGREDEIDDKKDFTHLSKSCADYKGDDKYETLPLIKLDGHGISGKDNDTAAWIEFGFGPHFKEHPDSVEEKPFAGIGMELAKEGEHFNGKKYKGIYFDYKTGENLKEKYIEYCVLTDQKFIEKGVSYLVKLPATGGKWFGAIVPFKCLMLPHWDDVDTIPFDATKITKLEWVIKGIKKGNAGELFVDNVYLLDKTIIGVKHVSKPDVKKNGIIFRQVDRKLLYTLPQGVNAADVSLFNLQGKCIALHSVFANGKEFHSLPVAADDLSNGIYILRMITKGEETASISKVFTIMR